MVWACHVSAVRFTHEEGDICPTNGMAANDVAQIQIEAAMQGWAKLNSGELISTDDDEQLKTTTEQTTPPQDHGYDVSIVAFDIVRPTICVVKRVTTAVTL